MPNFFVSSAAGDDDPYVAQFLNDLVREVDGLGGAAADAFLGTVSSDLREWPPGMAKGLGRCDVFVALCSPRYFLNDAAGRQWQVFRERLRQHEVASGVRPPALMALSWTGDADPIDSDADVRGPVPPRPQQGLRQLVRLRSLRGEYKAFVAELAVEIAASARLHRLARLDPPPFATVTSAFNSGRLPRIRFVVVAGTRPEMAGVREDLAYYGATQSEWTPYLPMRSEPLADRARAVASDHLFESAVGSLNDVIDQIERAKRNDEIVVVLVDGWATQVDVYQRLLVEIDRRGLGDTALLVPASRADAETVNNRDELLYGLRWALRNTAGRSDALLHTEIDTPDQFDAELAGVLEEARNRIIREGPVRQLPGGDGDVGERPILRGP